MYTETTTSFFKIYDSFFSRITDDMYLELTEMDTFKMLQGLLINAIPRFEFPRFNVFDYVEGELVESTYQGVESDDVEVPAYLWVGGEFNHVLTTEEINILGLCMTVEWLIQQLETADNTRMKYAGSDYKVSSQANHMSKIKIVLEATKVDCKHMQRLYRRRIVSEDGSTIQSTLGQIIATPVYGITNANIDRINWRRTR